MPRNDEDQVTAVRVTSRTRKPGHRKFRTGSGDFPCGGLLNQRSRHRCGGNSRWNGRRGTRPGCFLPDREEIRAPVPVCRL